MGGPASCRARPFLCAPGFGHVKFARLRIASYECEVKPLTGEDNWPPWRSTLKPAIN